VVEQLIAEVAAAVVAHLRGLVFPLTRCLPHWMLLLVPVERLVGHLLMEALEDIHR